MKWKTLMWLAPLSFVASYVQLNPGNLAVATIAAVGAVVFFFFMYAVSTLFKKIRKALKKRPLVKRDFLISAIAIVVASIVAWCIYEWILRDANQEGTSWCGDSQSVRLAKPADCINMGGKSFASKFLAKSYHQELNE